MVVARLLMDPETIYTGYDPAIFKVADIFKLTNMDPFAAWFIDKRGRDTGRDTRRAVGSWGH